MLDLNNRMSKTKSDYQFTADRDLYSGLIRLQSAWRERCFEQRVREDTGVAGRSRGSFDERLRLDAGEDEHQLPGQLFRVGRSGRAGAVAQPPADALLVPTDDRVRGVVGIEEL